VEPPRNLALRAIYRLLHLTVRGMLAVQYRIRVQGHPGTLPKGPMFVLSNHPNALLDPFLTITRIRRPVFFLANAGLYRLRPVARFLDTFYCIPIQRPQDTGGAPIDNADAFRRTRAHLAAGGAIFAAPEGTSEREYRLRPIKTGTARIALDLLDRREAPEVHFLMAGITYQAPQRFRSRVLLRFAPVLTLRAEDIPGEPGDWSRVLALTANLEKTMQGLILHGSDAQDAALVRASVLLVPWLRHAQWEPRLAALKRFLDDQGEAGATWVEELERVTAGALADGVDPGWSVRTPSWGGHIGMGLVYAALLPNLVLLGLPELLRRVLKQHPVYDATVHFVGGMLSYPLGTILLWWLGGMLGLDPVWRWALIGYALVSGPLLWDQLLKLRDRAACRRWQRLKQRQPERWAALEVLLEPLRRALP
jgi:glycerol-3-phosphate O-acyltransferase/dihydroxyacetone phosphate acyltransferase